MPDEVFRPPLGFEEEFVTLAEQALNGDQFDPDAPLPSDHLSSSDAAALTGASLHALGQSLSLLADNFPHVDRGVQSRVKPSDWKLVMELLTDAEVFPEQVLQSVHQRMGALYSASGSNISHNPSQELLVRAEAELEDLKEELLYDIYPAEE